MGKRGPKPKGKTVVFSTRLNPEIKKALQAAAKKRQPPRTLSDEAQIRLTRSFSDDKKLEDIFGDRRVYAVMRIIASLLELQPAGTRRPWLKNWMDDARAFDRMIRTIVEVLTALRPPQGDYDPEENHGWETVFNKAAASEVAETKLRAIVEAPDMPTIQAGSRDPAMIKTDLDATYLQRMHDYADWLRLTPAERGAALSKKEQQP